MIDTSWSDRLKEQRKALGLSQEQAGSAAGVARETWSRYESGKLTLGMDVLTRLAMCGFDVMYVLTGNAPPLSVHEGSKAIPPRGRSLLDNYLACDEDGQRAIERLATLEAQSKAVKRA